MQPNTGALFTFMLSVVWEMNNWHNICQEIAIFICLRTRAIFRIFVVVEWMRCRWRTTPSEIESGKPAGGGTMAYWLDVGPRERHTKTMLFACKQPQSRLLLVRRHCVPFRFGSMGFRTLNKTLERTWVMLLKSIFSWLSPIRFSITARWWSSYDRCDQTRQHQRGAFCLLSKGKSINGWFN